MQMMITKVKGSGLKKILYVSFLSLSVFSLYAAANEITEQMMQQDVAIDNRLGQIREEYLAEFNLMMQELAEFEQQGREWEIRAAMDGLFGRVNTFMDENHALLERHTDENVLWRQLYARIERHRALISTGEEMERRREERRRARAVAIQFYEGTL